MTRPGPACLVMASARGSHGGAAHAVPFFGAESSPQWGPGFSRMEQDLPRAASLIHLPAPLWPKQWVPVRLPSPHPCKPGQGKPSFVLSKHQTRGSCHIVRDSHRHRRHRVHTRPLFQAQPRRYTSPEPATMLVSLTVGKVDAGVTVLLTPDKRLARPPLLLLLRRLQIGGHYVLTRPPVNRLNSPRSSSRPISRPDPLSTSMSRAIRTPRLRQSARSATSRTRSSPRLAPPSRRPPFSDAATRPRRASCSNGTLFSSLRPT